MIVRILTRSIAGMAITAAIFAVISARSGNGIAWWQADNSLVAYVIFAFAAVMICNRVPFYGR